MDHRCSVGDRWPLRVPNRGKGEKRTRYGERERRRRRRRRREELPGAVLSYSLRSSGNGGRERGRGNGSNTQWSYCLVHSLPLSLSLSRLLSLSLSPLGARGSRGRRSRNGSSSLDDARDSPVPSSLPHPPPPLSGLYRSRSPICPEKMDSRFDARRPYAVTSTDFLESQERHALFGPQRMLRYPAWRRLQIQPPYSLYLAQNAII